MLRSACRLDFNGFRHLVSYTYPGDWVAGRKPWLDLLEKLIKVLSERCGVEFYLKRGS
ncbi:MAG: hypothetical protein LM600_02020 [Thaumarchaeota archaeon]|nr:hypothetical protein [Nitrososphaerota archaeon]